MKLRVCAKVRCPELGMPSSGHSIRIPLVIVELLLCLHVALCDSSFLTADRGFPLHPSGSDLPHPHDAATSVRCDSTLGANISAASGCHSQQTNFSLHLSYLHKQVSRSVRFPGSNEGRHLNALKDYVYVMDTPEADALAGDALDASIGGDIYSLGANEVGFSCEQCSVLSF
jgi:hypothetical protein